MLEGLQDGKLIKEKLPGQYEKNEVGTMKSGRRINKIKIKLLGSM